MTVCSFLPPSRFAKATRESRAMHVCVCVLIACLPMLCVHTRLCFFVCSREVGGEKAGGERANLYKLWRIQGHPFMFCQPAVKQFPIKVVLNSSVIPIPASQFPPSTLGVFQHHPFSPLHVHHISPAERSSRQAVEVMFSMPVEAVSDPTFSCFQSSQSQISLYCL